MVKFTPHSLLANTIWFYLVWFSAVVAQSFFMVFALLVGYLIWIQLSSKRLKTDLKTLMLAPLGIAIDFTFYQSGIYQFESGFPLWLVLLWACFVLCLDKSFYFLRHQYALAAFVGGVAGGFNYWMASRLGAVSFYYSDIATVAWISGYWAALLPLMFFLQNRMQKVMV